MNAPRFDDVRVGDSIGELILPPVSRHRLALYCGGSGDHNPLHVDIDFAREAGHPDVIAHGMLIMGFVSRLLGQWMPQSSVRSFDARFQAMTHIGDVTTCTGEIVEKLVTDGERRVRLSLSASTEGSQTVVAEAVVALD